MSNYAQEANDVELFERAPLRNIKYYGIAYKNLSKWFPNEMKSFVMPMLYASDNKLSPTNCTRIFNSMLSAFKSILEKSPYVCRRIGMTPNDIKDEYYYAEGEFISTSSFRKMYKDDTGNTMIITFSSFKNTLRDRHNMLVKKGKLKPNDSFCKVYDDLMASR